MCMSNVLLAMFHQPIPPGMEFHHIAGYDSDGELERNADNHQNPPIWSEVIPSSLHFQRYLHFLNDSLSFALKQQ